MKIRRFRESDAKEVSELIIKTIRISNAKDYPEDLMELLVQSETPENVIGRASWTHFYVVTDNDRIIGCGAIGPYWGKEDESSLFTIFVLPEYQGRGIGRLIVSTLEKDPYALRAKRIEIPASITGLKFYRKLGYDYKDGNDQIDEEHLYRLEKFKEPEKIYMTERLYMRRWRDDDAEDMFMMAKDPAVGPITGWPPHQSVTESLYVIRNVLCGAEAYAICLNDENTLVGSVELKMGGRGEGETELGYWLGKEYWGRGIMTEAGREMLRHAFEDLGMKRVWLGYYDGNDKSRRVAEKLGFKYIETKENVDVPLLNVKRTGHVNMITYEEWKKGQE